MASEGFSNLRDSVILNPTPGWICGANPAVIPAAQLTCKGEPSPNAGAFPVFEAGVGSALDLAPAQLLYRDLTLAVPSPTWGTPHPAHPSEHAGTGRGDAIT